MAVSRSKERQQTYRFPCPSTPNAVKTTHAVFPLQF
jgi:hypothetical protein